MATLRCVDGVVYDGDTEVAVPDYITAESMTTSDGWQVVKLSLSDLGMMIYAGAGMEALSAAINTLTLKAVKAGKLNCLCNDMGGCVVCRVGNRLGLPQYSIESRRQRHALGLGQ